MSGNYQIRALVVDDSEFFAQMTAETLTEQHGIDAVAETSPVAALERIDEQAFDCVVSDYEMPEMDGLTFLDRLRDSEPSLPFILLTGRGDEETASEAIAAGVADYLLKLEVVEDKQYGRLANRIENVVEQNRTRKKYESLVENSDDGIAQLDEDGRLLSVNPAMAERHYDASDELEGLTLFDIVPDATAEDRVRAAREAVATGEPTATEDEVGGNYYHNQFVPVETGPDGRTVQLVSRDITEQRRRRKELERQNERLERFASVVSHDLRNPLNVARSALELLDRPTDEDEELYEKVDRSLHRMSDIIDDVLQLARQGETVDEVEMVDVATIAEDAWQYVETDDSELVLAESTRIPADAGRLQDLFANLFRNAVEHNEGPVTVEVGLYGEGSIDGFYVADDGAGIEGGGDDVFELGYTTQDEGTGIGLALVSEIAEAHGWSVRHTRPDGGGARFEIDGVD